MRVDLYTVCWNEADFLPFFFRDYDPWVDRYVVYDDGSTDGTAEAAKSAGAHHVISNGGNRGLAQSFQRGLDAAEVALRGQHARLAHADGGASSEL